MSALEIYTCDFCGKTVKSDPKAPSISAVIYTEDWDRDYACEACWEAIKNNLRADGANTS